MTCGIYQILNKSTGWKYIGASKDFCGRKKAHLSYLRRGLHINKKLQADWNEYGEETFEFSILEECSLEQLQERERDYLPSTIAEEAYTAGSYYNKAIKSCYTIPVYPKHRFTLENYLERVLKQGKLTWMDEIAPKAWRRQAEKELRLRGLSVY